MKFQSSNFQRPPLNPDRAFVYSPDSKWLAYIPVGQKLFRNVYVAQFSPDGQQVFYLENGRIQVASVDQRRPPCAG